MAQRGRKTTPPSEKRRRGTAQPSRDIAVVLDVANSDSTGEKVQIPDGIPTSAEIIWKDYAPAAERMGTLKPCDAMSFGQWCVMTAHLQAAWSIRGENGEDGSVPIPSSYIQQWRTLGEMFGLVGLKSRVVSGGKPAGDECGGAQSSANPFARNGKR
ncbi:hypothetical protein [Nisaea nitritireducens]|uniref:hypothetical protein n=1 Tax=Nisaea nitritireducens TaxID=568392 RepID=UPI001867B0DD|nr:hypothetical protein [Nisaea nitritireducens]